MLSNFWAQWIIATALAIVGACAVGVYTHSWIIGIIAYFVLGMIKEHYLLSKHTKKVDNN